MCTAYKILKVSFDQNNLILVLDNQQYVFKLAEISKKLLSASEKERNSFTLSPSGYGIHWPEIDEDLSVNGLLHLIKKQDVA